MMSQGSLAQPPFLATWLLELFAAEEHAESIAGDLLEEFSSLQAKSGLASARRWYWRQSTKTVVRLIGSGFRTAPWASILTVLGGLFLLSLGSSLPERLIEGGIHAYEHHVTPYRNPAQWYAFVQWLNSSILIGHFFVSLVVGCLAAWAARGREVVVTMTLGFVSLVLAVAASWMAVATHRPGAGDVTFLPRIMVLYLCNSIMIVIGGIILRESRSAMSRHSSVV
jgi:hypothetical protein